MKIQKVDREVPENLKECDSIRFSHLCASCAYYDFMSSCKKRMEFYNQSLENGEIIEIRAESEMGYKYI
jgi:hypothetical protein